MKRPLYSWMWVAVAVVCFVLIMQLAPTNVWVIVIGVTVALVTAAILTATLNAMGRWRLRHRRGRRDRRERP